MSARTAADRALTVFLSILFLPGRIIEEGIHAFVSLPFADRVAVEIEPDRGTAVTRVQFRDGTPRWAVVAAHLAPEAIAAAAGLAVIAYWLLGGAVWWPRSPLDWTLLSLLGAQYLAIVLPSESDRAGARGGG